MSAATVKAVAFYPGSNFSKIGKPVVTLVAIFLSGCVQKAEKNIEVETQVSTEESVEKRVEYSFDANCNPVGENLVESQLRSKLIMLSKLNDNYEFVKYGDREVKSSIFYGMHQLSEDEFLEGSLDVSNFEHLVSQISNANFMSIRGADAIGGGSLYPSAGIEEYIFSTSDCAERAEKFLRWVNKHGPWGGNYYKTPTIFFRDDQIIYHIVGAGEYMRSRLPSIKSAILTSEE